MFAVGKPPVGAGPVLFVVFKPGVVTVGAVVGVYTRLPVSAVPGVSGGEPVGPTLVVLVVFSDTIGVVITGVEVGVVALDSEVLKPVTGVTLGNVVTDCVVGRPVDGVSDQLPTLGELLKSGEVVDGEVLLRPVTGPVIFAGGVVTPAAVVVGVSEKLPTLGEDSKPGDVVGTLVLFRLGLVTTVMLVPDGDVVTDVEVGVVSEKFPTLGELLKPGVLSTGDEVLSGDVAGLVILDGGAVALRPGVVSGGADPYDKEEVGVVTGPVAGVESEKLPTLGDDSKSGELVVSADVVEG